MYLQHPVFVRPLLLPAAIAAGSSNGVTLHLVGYILEYVGKIFLWGRWWC
jgi:hypothetical protein